MNIYEQAVQKWGKEKQLDMIAEECAELIATIQQFKRGRSALKLIEEWADVELMIEQLYYIFPECVSYKNNQRRFKIKRLRKRLKGEIDG